ncbi:hypothetical protein ABKW28_19225 [Nocardioides sp. 31GB23]|uniref:SGNH/GDSL hydrolase family protein n=1 Tax=Nocardioides sp. 31GB23 TaxID=3156065 RepID=UPI0032AF645F
MSRRITPVGLGAAKAIARAAQYATDAAAQVTAAAAKVTEAAGFATAASGHADDASASAALARDISNIDTTDDAVDAALNLPGSKSAATLSASIDGSALTAKYPMPSYGRQVSDYLAGTTTHLRWLTWGDSMAQGLFEKLYEDLRRAFGGGIAGVYFAGSSRSITATATTGTVTESTTSYDAWATGAVTTFAAGSTRTYGVGGGSFVCDQVKVYYITEPGAGTFKVQIDGADATGTIDASAASIGLGVVTLTPALGSHTVKVVNLTGTVRTPGAGVGMVNSTISGIVVANVSKGGLALPDAFGTAGAKATLTAFLADFAPHVISHEMKETAATYEAGLTDEFDVFTAGAPNADVVLIATPAVGLDPDDDQAAQNTILKRLAATYGYSVVDLYAAFGPFTQARDVYGFYDPAENTHYNDAGKRFGSAFLARDLDLFGRFKRQSDTRKDTTVEETLTLGNNPLQRVMQFIADLSTALDVTTRFRRKWEWADMNGNVFAVLRSGNSTTAVSGLPRYSSIGDAMAGFFGSSASLLQVRRWSGSNFNGTGDLQARALLRVRTNINASAVSGAVVLDLSLGSVFYVTLDANVTSLTVSNLPAADGVTVVVHFAQDATGGRTVSGLATSIKAAGGSIALTAAANKVDTYTFDSINSQLQERGRALNK